MSARALFLACALYGPGADDHVMARGVAVKARLNGRPQYTCLIEGAFPNPQQCYEARLCTCCARFGLHCELVGIDGFPR